MGGMAAYGTAARKPWRSSQAVTKATAPGVSRTGFVSGSGCLRAALKCAGPGGCLSGASFMAHSGLQAKAAAGPACTLVLVRPLTAYTSATSRPITRHGSPAASTCPQLRPRHLTFWPKFWCAMWPRQQCRGCSAAALESECVTWYVPQP